MKAEEIEACYRTLQLPPEAGMPDVKRAFHRLAARHHPDVNPNNAVSAERFKKITRAYEILKKHLRRQKRGALPEPARPASVRSRRREAAEGFVMPANAVLPVDELRVRVCHSENCYVRLHAVRALAAIGTTEGAWCLVKALQDRDTEVRREAVRALGALRVSVAVMPLIYYYRTADFYTRHLVVKSLEQMDSPLATKFLRFIGDPHVAVEAGGAGDVSSA